MALHSLVVLSLPYMDTQMGNELLAAAAPENCTGPVPATLQSWMALYRAVADRDASSIVTLAEDLLSDDQAEDMTRQRYLLAAAMLGRLSRDQSAEALRVWQEHGQGVDANLLTADLRLLVSLALSSDETMTASTR